MYLVKTPFWLRMFYPSRVWKKDGAGKRIYLTFDDGPHPTATPFVLDTLKEYNAKASFFCIGKNVAAEPLIYQRILDEGHSVGNHTMHHVNGWKTGDDEYVKDYSAATDVIKSDLFRPPYGRLKKTQQKKLEAVNLKLQTIMWTVLSGDFDTDLTPEGCLGYVLYHTKPGSIIVFHDSTKAWPRMSYALPRMLAHFSSEGYVFDTL